MDIVALIAAATSGDTGSGIGIPGSAGTGSSLGTGSGSLSGNNPPANWFGTMSGIPSLCFGSACT